MKREDLKALGLTDDQIEKVMAENGKDIEASKNTLATKEQELIAKTKEVETLNGQIKERDTQLDTLKKADPEKLQAEITRLQGENKTAQEKHDAELKQIKLDTAIERKLRDANAVDVVAVRALLDPTKISLDGENLIGIDDQIKSLQESKKWAFGESTPGSTGRSQGGGGTDTKTLKDAIQEQMYPT